jgi:hypothetical protein
MFGGSHVRNDSKRWLTLIRAAAFRSWKKSLAAALVLDAAAVGAGFRDFGRLAG